MPPSASQLPSRLLLFHDHNGLSNFESATPILSQITICDSDSQAEHVGARHVRMMDMPRSVRKIVGILAFLRTPFVKQKSYAVHVSNTRNVAARRVPVNARVLILRRHPHRAAPVRHCRRYTLARRNQSSSNACFSTAMFRFSQNTNGTTIQ